MWNVFAKAVKDLLKLTILAKSSVDARLVDARLVDARSGC